MKENNKLLREGIKHNILFVNISRSSKKAIKGSGYDWEILYWATKESWIVTKSKVENIDCICPYVNKRIVGTFVLHDGTEWYLAGKRQTKNGEQRRYGFSGYEVDYGYEGKDVSDWTRGPRSSHYCWERK